MPTSSKELEPQSFIQRSILVIVGLVILIPLLFYFINFHQGLSSSQEVWGQFGDFVGGLVNPIIGFLTVWLLTVSLRQNQLALKQAHEEIQLARRALEASEATQARTEAALREQIEIADQTRDMANAVSISNYLHIKSDSLGRDLNATSFQLESVRQNQLRRDIGAATELASRLDKLLEVEAERLLNRYPSSDK